MFSKILVPYDGSELSKKAVEVAVSFAQLNPVAQIEIIHVSFIPYLVVSDGVFTPTPSQTIDYLDHTQVIIDEVKQLASSMKNVTVVQKEGAIAKTILDHAKENQCDLIIMGSRGHSALSEFVLGSVSHDVVQHSEIAVLIVK